MNVLVLYGPNLNLLGIREPEIYGTTMLDEIKAMVDAKANELGITVKQFQSNHEGALIDLLHEHRTWMDMIIFNPAALTHYSYALRDAVASVSKPMMEVHLTNIYEREEKFRRFSVFEGLKSVEQILGKGTQGFIIALERCATS